MTKKIFIADLQGREELETLFLVKYMAVQEAKDGKKYLNVVLTDASGDLESRAWNGAEEIAGRITRGDYVRAKGKVNLFQGRRQFILSEIQTVDAVSVNTDDFVMKSNSSPEAMLSRLKQLVGQLSDYYIRELLLQILSDQEIARRLKLWPAGKSIHHAYQSGLLEHILSCAELSQMLSRHYQVNENYVIAGAILHDLCKIYELSDGANVEYTDEGKLVGHLVKGVELVEKFAAKIPHFPAGVKLHLKHVLLSHHGEYAYGSPKIPQTSEAYLVHLIDLMDSKMNSMEMVRRHDNQQGPWSAFVKHLDRIVYKPELPFYPEKIEDRGAEAKSVLGKQLEGFKLKD